MLGSRGARDAAAAVLSVLALLGAGCGGDEGDAGSEGSVEPISREEFISQADVICAEENGAIDAQAEEELAGGSGPTAEEIEAFINEVTLPSVSNQADEIEALGDPEGAEDQKAELVAALREAVSAAEEDPIGVTGPGPDNPFNEANEIAEEIGFEECGG